jgi:hypothetical protein
MTNIELDDDQAQRALIVQLVASALAAKPSGLAGGRPAPADDVLKVAEWVYSGEVGEDSVAIDEDQDFLKDVGQMIQRAREQSFADLLKNLTRKAPPTDQRIEKFMVDWGKTEADTPEAIATEVFHPTRPDEVLPGFMTAQWRITKVDQADSDVTLEYVSRETGDAGVVTLDARAEELQIVCGACTEQYRILNAKAEQAAAGR